jgi:hypothetical protein
MHWYFVSSKVAAQMNSFCSEHLINSITAEHMLLQPLLFPGTWEHAFAM